MYKVFVDNIPIFFTKEEKVRTNLPSVYFPKLLRSAYKDFIRELRELSLSEEIFVASVDPFITIQTFFKEFRYLEAAGGLVQNSVTNKYLFIKRHGVWDIPKGKIEKQESPEKAAIREVNEECGIENLKIQDLICHTYHTYFAYDKYHFKKTFWFKMTSDQTEGLKPQSEEGITEVKWLNKDEWSEIKENTYLSILDVLKSV